MHDENCTTCVRLDRFAFSAESNVQRIRAQSQCSLPFFMQVIQHVISGFEQIIIA